MKKILSIAVLSVMYAMLPAQTRSGVTVSGYITDERSGETLIGAGVLSLAGPSGKTGAVTNVYGYYSLTLPEGSTRLQYSYVGYGSHMEDILLQRDTVINVSLAPDLVLSASTVVAQKDAGIASTYLGAIEVPLAQIRNTPVIFGEADVLKAIQMMPGVQGGNEGFTGLYVRGGGPDENLILLDGVPIYNVDHMMGLFSVFQPEAVKKVTLYKGSFPARYGGRVSSIVDIRTNDGNMKEMHGNVSVGAVSEKFHLEGPIIRDRLSYSISGRGMHTAVWAPLIRKLMPDGEYVNYYFYDLNGKLSWRLSDRDRFFLGAYSGRDRFLLDADEDSDKIDDPGDGAAYRSTFRTDTQLSWGNDVVSLRWNHIFSQKLFANTTLAFNRYRMLMGSDTVEKIYDGNSSTSMNYDVSYRSGIRDLSAKLDFDYVPLPAHLVKFGTEYIYHTFIPETLTLLNSEIGPEGDKKQFQYRYGNQYTYGGHDISLYAEDDIALGESLTVNPGGRLSLFLTEGRGYWNLQPRISLKYVLPFGMTAKAGYARMAQYVHLLSSAQVSLPIDLWVPITKDIRPVTSDQFSAGLYYDRLSGWEFSVEGYFKAINNILEYKDGTLVIASSTDWEKNVEMGQGRAAGLELMAQKTAGKATGWIAYTLSKSERRFPDGTINMGRWFPYKYDRRHSVNINFNWTFSPTIDANVAWSYASGGTTTLYSRTTSVLDPEGRIRDADYVSGRNNFRLPASHRLNLGVNFHFFHRRTEGILNLSVYNVYNQMNPNFVYLRYETRWDELQRTFENYLTMEKVTILPILPSLSYTLTF